MKVMGALAQWSPLTHSLEQSPRRSAQMQSLGVKCVCVELEGGVLQS